MGVEVNKPHFRVVVVETGNLKPCFVVINCHVNIVRVSKLQIVTGKVFNSRHFIAKICGFMSYKCCAHH